MSEFSPNDWWSYLRHSWGTKPEQKAREKEYNHEYWEKNKERIMEVRRRHGDKAHKGEEIKTSDNLNDRIASESGELEDLIKINAEMGGYSDEVMENIRQHNQNIIDNIKALTDKVNSYINDNPDMPEDQKKELLASLREQIDKAMDMAIDLRKESSRDYLSGDNSSEPSSKSSQKSSASNGSSEKSTAERNREIQAENAKKLSKNRSIYTEGAKRRESNQNKPSTQSTQDKPWYAGGDEQYAKALEERKKNKR